MLPKEPYFTCFKEIKLGSVIRPITILCPSKFNSLVVTWLAICCFNTTSCFNVLQAKILN